MIRVLTYGTFDLFHIGHLRLLERLAQLGDELVVGVSTDEFNTLKGKRCIVPFQDRIQLVAALRCVTGTFREDDWSQKENDIMKYGIDIFGMGDDWVGKFDDLKNRCSVVYLPRTEGVSTTFIRHTISIDSQLTGVETNNQLID